MPMPQTQELAIRTPKGSLQTLLSNGAGDYYFDRLGGDDGIPCEGWACTLTKLQT